MYVYHPNTLYSSPALSKLFCTPKWAHMALYLVLTSIQIPPCRVPIKVVISWTPSVTVGMLVDLTNTHTRAQIKTHLHVCIHMRESTPTHLHTNTNRGIYKFINIFSPQHIIFCRNLSQCQFLLRYDVGISHKPQQQFHNGCRLFIKGVFQDC